jgi:hypothetical protein
MVPRAGVEPARPYGQRILSPQRLPFRHPGTRAKIALRVVNDKRHDVVFVAVVVGPWVTEP